VPRDIALIGFDSWEPMALDAEPPLTSPDMCPEDVGRVAAGRLLAAINDEPNRGIHAVPCRLVVRVSTNLLIRRSARSLVRSPDLVA